MRRVTTGIIQKYQSMSVQVKAAFWFLICSFLQKGIAVISTPVFTRLLSTAEYGSFAVFNSWMGIVTIIVTLELFAGVYTQGLIKFSDERNVFSSSLQGLTLTLVSAWTVIYLAFHSFFNRIMSLTTVQVLAMLVIIWSSSAFGLWAAEQRVLYKYQRLVAVTLVVSVLQPALGVFFVLHAEDKVTARILGILLAQIVFYVFCFVAQMTRGRRFFSAKFWRYAILFNLPLVPHYLSQSVLSSSDRIMIERMIGKSEAGIYGLAYSLSQVMLLVNMALMQTLNPWYFEKIKNKDYKPLGPISYIGLVVVALTNLLLIALAPEAVAIFAPKSYYAAIWIIPPVAMSSFFLYLYDIFSKFEFYYEKTKVIMVSTVVGALLNVVLNYVFIRGFGYLAAGYTTLFCYIVYAVCHYLAMRSVCRKQLNGLRPFNMRVICGIMLAFLAAGFGIMATYEQMWLRYTILAVMVVTAVVFRNRIREMLNRIMEIRKSK